jgi:hypothetical protein
MAMWLGVMLLATSVGGDVDAAAAAPCAVSTAAVEMRAAAASIETAYAVVCRRILERVGALREEFGSMHAMQSPAHHEYNVTWMLDDPAQPAGKRNARRAVYGEDGYWFSLQFYRGEWRGAAVFIPIEFGDLKLWFDFGHAGNAAEISAITAILREERARFCTQHRCAPDASGIQDRPPSLARIHPAGWRRN